MDWDPLILSLDQADRQRALAQAGQAANPHQGRAVFLESLAMDALGHLWQWLALEPSGELRPVSRLPGEVACLAVPQVGSIALLPFVMESQTEASGAAQIPKVQDSSILEPLAMPLDWPDHVVAFVPVGIDAQLTGAWLWGWLAVGDLPLPPHAPERLPVTSLQDWEALETYLARVRSGLVWIAEAADPIARQTRQAIAPKQRAAVVMYLERLYQSTRNPSPSESQIPGNFNDRLPDRLTEWFSTNLPPNLKPDRTEGPGADADAARELPGGTSRPPMTYGQKSSSLTPQVRDRRSSYGSQPTTGESETAADWETLPLRLLDRLRQLWDEQTFEG